MSPNPPPLKGKHAPRQRNGNSNSDPFANLEFFFKTSKGQQYVLAPNSKTVSKNKYGGGAVAGSSSKNGNEVTSKRKNLLL